MTIRRKLPCFGVDFGQLGYYDVTEQCVIHLPTQGNLEGAFAGHIAGEAWQKAFENRHAPWVEHEVFFGGSQPNYILPVAMDVGFVPCDFDGKFGKF